MAGIELIIRGAESERSTTSTHFSWKVVYPFTNTDAESPRTDSTDSKLNSLSSKDMGSILEAPMTSLSWTNSPVTDFLASSIVKDDARVEDAMIKHTVMR
jgi:hypothetical protein